MITIEKMIEYLRTSGYEIKTRSQLITTTREEVAIRKNDVLVFDFDNFNKAEVRIELLYYKELSKDLEFEVGRLKQDKKDMQRWLNECENSQEK